MIFKEEHYWLVWSCEGSIPSCNEKRRIGNIKLRKKYKIYVKIQDRKDHGTEEEKFTISKMIIRCTTTLNDMML